MASWKYDRDQQHYGMEPTGYDADTQVYTYRDDQGNYYNTDEGSGRYGNLQQTSAASTSRQSGFNGEGVAAEAVANDWQMMKPFFLLVTVVLMSLLWYVNSAGGAAPGVNSCQPGFEEYAIAKGDTCWALAEDRKTTVDGLVQANEGLVCGNLQVGRRICIPELKG